MSLFRIHPFIFSLVLVPIQIALFVWSSITSGISEIGFSFIFPRGSLLVRSMTLICGCLERIVTKLLHVEETEESV